MAAVICTSLSELCRTSCNAVSRVICLPCKALNLGCERLGDLLCTPFMPFLVVTFALNTPGVVYGFMSVDNYGCSDLFRWLIVNAVLSGIHMFGGMYIVNRIREPAAEELSSSKTQSSVDKMEEGGYVLNNFSVPKNNERGGPNSFQRVKHVLCYDKGMALYILVVVFWMVWICMGVNRRLTVDDGNEACDELISYMNITISLGYVWMTVIGVAFCCSFLCLR